MQGMLVGVRPSQTIFKDVSNRGQKSPKKFFFFLPDRAIIESEIYRLPYTSPSKRSMACKSHIFVS